MSYEQEYLPPKGTKYEWKAKALNYSPWYCSIKGGGQPLRATLRVDLMGGKYHWSVDVFDFHDRATTYKGTKNDGLKACLEAERVAEKKLGELIPKWALRAFDNGWRPTR